MSTDFSDEIKRWTAKRRTALVLELLCGETTVHEATLKHDLEPADTEHWKETITAPHDFYNNQRPHQALGYPSPAERRAQYQLNVA